MEGIREKGQKFRLKCQKYLYDLVAFGVFSQLLICLISTLIIGCATRPEFGRPAKLDELVRRDRVIGDTFGTRFESYFLIKADPKVEIFLKGLVQSLLAGSQFGLSEPKIRFHKGLSRHSDLKLDLHWQENVDARFERPLNWRNFSLPGSRLYFSASLLKDLKYENEWAAVVAIELAHLIHGHFLKHLERLLDAKQSLPGEFRENVSGKLAQKETLHLFLDHVTALDLGQTDFIGPRSVFEFTEAEEIRTFQTAVQLLYQSGYDSRGIVTVLQMFEANRKISPYSEIVLNKLIEQSRYFISSLVPVRNPIVRSQSFVGIRERIQRL